MKKIPKRLIGKRVAITWDDPTGSVGGELDDQDLAKCISEGKLVALDKKKLVLQSSIYPGTKQGDFTCIHRGLVTAWKVI